ncbi:unnamed protein product [Phytomonas sp. Hart1]|nr:unnamed protein product [Phytomonas sp. Hart1]|eukprot:CCW72299.1 unnamed protein product [Phytomonas sp. isolate Hart1]
MSCDHEYTWRLRGSKLRSVRWRFDRVFVRGKERTTGADDDTPQHATRTVAAEPPAHVCAHGLLLPARTRTHARTRRYDARPRAHGAGSAG